MSGITSGVAFGVGGVALVAAYMVVQRSLQTQTVTHLIVSGPAVQIGGKVFVIPTGISAEEVQSVEAAFRELVNERAFPVILATLGILFVLSLVIGWFIAGRLLRPVADLNDLAADIEATDLSRRIPVAGDDELARLSTTFNAMLDRLDRAFVGQKEFLAQTSHDLRTPLAVIRSNLDVTLGDPGASADDWRSTGQIVLRASERMSDMVESLLAAARLEASKAEIVSIDLAEVVDSVVDEAKARASVTAEARTAVVHGNRPALIRALENLVENARNASPEGAPIVVSSGSADGWAYLGVADRGSGVDPAILDDVSAGGLGLAIVRQVAAAHDGIVRAMPRQGGGSVFVIWLPTEEGADRPPDQDPAFT